MAASSVASLYRAGGLVRPSFTDAPTPLITCPSAGFGSSGTDSSSGFFFSESEYARQTPFQPSDMTLRPFAVKEEPPHEIVTAVSE